MTIILIVLGCVVACMFGSIIYHVGKIAGRREGRQDVLDEIEVSDKRSEINLN